MPQLQLLTIVLLIAVCAGYDFNVVQPRLEYEAPPAVDTVGQYRNVPNEETAEVAALRAQHLAAHAEVKRRLAGGHSLDNLPQDTPEVAAAKVEFFKRFEAEKLRHKLLRRKQSSPSPPPPPLPRSSLLSQPIYMKALPDSGFVYNYQKTPSQDYFPVYLSLLFVE